MSDVVKAETIRLIFSMLFMSIVLVGIYFLLPKITAKAGKDQAKAFWRAEREANEARLFGGED